MGTTFRYQSPMCLMCFRHFFILGSIATFNYSLFLMMCSPLSLHISVNAWQPLSWAVHLQFNHLALVKLFYAHHNGFFSNAWWTCWPLLRGATMYIQALIRCVSPVFRNFSHVRQCSYIYMLYFCYCVFLVFTHHLCGDLD